MEEPVVKLAPELQLLTNLVKMVAYQPESDLSPGLGPGLRRTEQQGRTLLRAALNGAADIQVSSTELRVTLSPLTIPPAMALFQRLRAGLSSDRPGRVGGEIG